MTDNEKENITVEAEEVNDFQEFKNKLKDRFTKKKKSKWHVVKGKIIAITPLVALATFLLIGFLADTWHPTWLVFLACPFVPIFLSLFDGSICISCNKRCILISWFFSSYLASNLGCVPFNSNYCYFNWFR